MYGLILMETGDAKDAIVPLRRATALDPMSAEAHYRLALALMQSGRGDQALDPLLATIHLNPNSPEPMAMLAWLLATYPDAKLRHGSDAMYFAERANALAKSSPRFMRVLAAAYAESGEFAQAAKAATDAAQIADASGDVALTTELQAAAARYRAGEATRDASLAGADSGAAIP
jgi:Flp pilus assembly protein TadD